jgi:hypothetical protein
VAGNRPFVHVNGSTLSLFLYASAYDSAALYQIYADKKTEANASVFL